MVVLRNTGSKEQINDVVKNINEGVVSRLVLNCAQMTFQSLFQRNKEKFCFLQTALLPTTRWVVAAKNIVRINGV